MKTIQRSEFNVLATLTLQSVLAECAALVPIHGWLGVLKLYICYYDLIIVEVKGYSSIPFHHSIPLILDSLPLSSTQAVHQTIPVVLHHPKEA